MSRIKRFPLEPSFPRRRLAGRPLRRVLLVILVAAMLVVPIFLVRRVTTRELVRHIGRYDPLATPSAKRRTLHLYFTEGPRGLRGGRWTYEISAVIDSGVANPPNDVGDTQFAVYDREGRSLFARHTSFARDANPGLTYMADFSVTPGIEHRLGRVDVVYRGKTYTRRALPDAPPAAHAVAVDDSHVRIELDCAHYPQVMVHYTADRDLTSASTDALETIRNCWNRMGATSLATPIETRNHTLYLDFNNGLLFTDRAVPIEVAGRA